MNRMTTRRAVGAAACAAAFAIGASATPASAVDARVRTATVQGQAAYSSYTLVSGGSYAYSGQAVMTNTAPGTGYATVEGTCAISMLFYFMSPQTLEADADCSIVDRNTGAVYRFGDAADVMKLPASTSTGIFTVPASHEYDLCFRAWTYELGYSRPDCRRLI